VNPKNDKKITHEDRLLSDGLVPGLNVEFTSFNSIFAVGLLFGVFITVVSGKSRDLFNSIGSGLNGSSETAVFGFDL
jgi:hypothetical protein